MDHNESFKTCSVCGVQNHSANKQCVNCNSYLDKSFTMENSTAAPVREIDLATANTPAVKKRLSIILLPVILIAFAAFLLLKGTAPGLSLTKPVPSVACNNAAGVESKDFEWKYNGRSFKWHVETSKELLEYDRRINKLINTFYKSDGITQREIFYNNPGDFQKMVQTISTNGKQDFNLWVHEETNDLWAADLADQLNQAADNSGYDTFHKAEFVQSFVGSAIPYKITEYPQLPAQTVFDNGDCLDKSILLAAILRHLDYQVALLCFVETPKDPGHMAVGVALNDNQITEKGELSYYNYHGVKYYFAETTAPNWRLGQVSTERDANVFEVK